MAQTLGQELKEERIKQNISLEQISAKTRINIKYLEAIEEGKYDILKEDVYIKAFIREYCQAVGMNKEKAIEQYEIERFGKPSQINIETKEIFDEKQKHTSAYSEINDKKASQPESKPAEPKEVTNKEEKKEEPKQEVKPVAATSSAPAYSKTYDSQEKTETSASAGSGFHALAGKNDITKYGILLSAIVLAGVLIYVLFFQDPSTEIVSEKPYEEFVNDSNNSPAAANNTPKLTAAPAKVDSLTLFITTQDTSWMKVTADDAVDYEFILYPNRQKMIKAKDKFMMHIGNTGSVQLKLNDKPLDFNVGRRSIRNVIINSKGVTLPAGVR